MNPRGTRPSPVGDILQTVLKRVDSEQQLRAYDIWLFWNDEVGEAIARRAQPARFRNGVLFVTVSTHAWMQELQFLKETLRDRLNARLGADLVRDIFFVSGTVDAPPAAEEAPADPVTVPGNRFVPLPAIADPALAAAFARVIEARAKRITTARPTRPRDGRAKKPR